MAEFSSLVITQKGRVLIAKVVTGQNINFTKICTSYAQYSSEQIEKLTVLGSIKQTSLDLSITRINDYSVRVNAEISNSSLSSGYFMHTVGLYANDPDEGEILYAAASETSGNCYISSYNGTTVSTMEICFVTTLDNADSIGFNPTKAKRAYWFTQEIFQSQRDVTGGKNYRFDSPGVPKRIFINYDSTTSFIDAPDYLPVGDSGIGLMIYELIPLCINKTDTIPSYFEQRIICYDSKVTFVRTGSIAEKISFTPWRTLASPYLGVEVTKDSPTTINILSELQAHFPWAKSFPSAVVYSNSSAATPAYFDGENLILSNKPAETVTYCLEFSEIPLIGTIRK